MNAVGSDMSKSLQRFAGLGVSLPVSSAPSRSLPGRFELGFFLITTISFSGEQFVSTTARKVFDLEHGSEVSSLLSGFSSLQLTL
jgi:hypothetical protein